MSSRSRRFYLGRVYQEISLTRQAPVTLPDMASVVITSCSSSATVLTCYLQAPTLTVRSDAARLSLRASSCLQAGFTQIYRQGLHLAVMPSVHLHGRAIDFGNSRHWSYLDLKRSSFCGNWFPNRTGERYTDLSCASTAFLVGYARLVCHCTRIGTQIEHTEAAQGKPSAADVFRANLPSRPITHPPLSRQLTIHPLESADLSPIV